MKISIVVEPGEYEDRGEEMIATSNGEEIKVEQWCDFQDRQEDVMFSRMLRRPREYLGIIEMAYEAGKRGDSLKIDIQDGEYDWGN